MKQLGSTHGMDKRSMYHRRAHDICRDEDEIVWDSTVQIDRDVPSFKPHTLSACFNPKYIPAHLFCKLFLMHSISTNILFKPNMMRYVSKHKSMLQTVWCAKYANQNISDYVFDIYYLCNITFFGFIFIPRIYFNMLDLPSKYYLTCGLNTLNSFRQSYSHSMDVDYAHLFDLGYDTPITSCGNVTHILYSFETHIMNILNSFRQSHYYTDGNLMKDIRKFLRRAGADKRDESEDSLLFIETPL